MSFNYAKEEQAFLEKWSKLSAEYIGAGMSVEDTWEMYNFDRELFCKERTYIRHNQEFPTETIAEESSESSLVNRYHGLTVQFDESGFSGRFDWIEAVNDSVLAGRLKALSVPDLELLTLIAIEGYSQADVARKMDCARNTISKKIARIKRFLK
ncbi:MAG: sigma factor-like helix-turn-helix DNA-binding protein [Oscillospiraceae bacterium]|nr:sigma factor-like helix-turn-helix DNA-binding protein [Oscillospiraceae bacterium]